LTGIVVVAAKIGGDSTGTDRADHVGLVNTGGCDCQPRRVRRWRVGEGNCLYNTVVVECHQAGRVVYVNDFNAVLLLTFTEDVRGFLERLSGLD